MFSASKSGKVGAVDPQFNYVTALLHGDGTNGAQNNTFLDSSSNAFTVTRNGTPTQGSFSPYGSLWSNYLDGSSYLTTGTNAGLGLGTSSFTVEFWVNVNSASTGNQNFVCGGGARSTNYDPLFCYTNGSSLLLLLSSNNSSWDITSGTTIGAISSATWYHVAIVRNGTTFYTFLNGVQTATFTSSSSIYQSSNAFIVGSGGTLGANYNAAGYVSNLRVLKGTALYTSAFTPPTAPLTAITNTQLLTNQSNRFVDNSSNALSITPSGTPSVQRFNPFLPTSSQAYSTSVYGGSGYFGGSDYVTFTASSATNCTGDFTLEGWCFLNSITINGGGNPRVIMFGGTSATGLQIVTEEATKAYRLDINNATAITANNVAVLNSWQHWAIVRSGSTITLYVNGISVGTATNSSTITNSGTSSIGGWVSGGGSYSNGYFSNFRLVVGTAVYTSAFTPPTAPLTAITNTQLLLSYTNGAIYDNAMISDLITVGSAQISTSVKKYGTGSLSFNGTTDYLILPKNNAILDPLSGNFTYECWLYLSSTQRGSIIGSGSGSNVFTVWVDYNSSSSGKLGMWASSNGTSWNMINSDAGGNGIGTTVLSTGVWYHVAYTRSGNTFRLFLNGNLEVSVTVSGTIASSNSSWEIGRQGTYGYYLNGYIDDLRITQGYARYTSNFTPPTAALPNYGS